MIKEFEQLIINSTLPELQSYLTAIIKEAEAIKGREYKQAKGMTIRSGTYDLKLRQGDIKNLEFLGIKYPAMKFNKESL